MLRILSDDCIYCCRTSTIKHGSRFTGYIFSEGAPRIATKGDSIWRYGTTHITNLILCCTISFSSRSLAAHRASLGILLVPQASYSRNGLLCTVPRTCPAFRFGRITTFDIFRFATFALESRSLADFQCDLFSVLRNVSLLHQSPARATALHLSLMSVFCCFDCRIFFHCPVPKYKIFQCISCFFRTPSSTVGEISPTVLLQCIFAASIADFFCTAPVWKYKIFDCVR